MIENITVLFIIILILRTASNRLTIGYLILAYYVIYIVISLDYFGFIIGDVFTSYKHFTVWYLIYTQITFVFFIFSLLIGLTTLNKTPFIYALWLLINLITSSVSAVFQSFETNSFLFVYNVLQNINLLVDILVVIVGTDNRLRGNYVVSSIIDYFNFYIDGWFSLAVVNRIKA